MATSPSIALRPHDRVRPFGRPSDKSPSNLETDEGKYYRADVHEGQIRVQFAEGVIPPFVRSYSLTAGSGGTRDEPKLVEDYRRRLYVLYTRDVGTSGSPDRSIYQAISDTQALDFDTPSPLTGSGASHPVVAAHAQNGILVRGWRRESDGAARVVVTGPGQSTITGDPDGTDPGPITISGVTLDDDSWGIQPGYEGPGRWWILGVVGGQPQLYWSADDLKTCTYFGDVLNGGKHPVLAVSRLDGRISAAAWFTGSHIKVDTFLPQGEDTLWGPTQIAASGGPLVWDDGYFGLAAAQEEARRWVLTAVAGGGGLTSDWWSTSEVDWTMTHA